MKKEKSFGGIEYMDEELKSNILKILKGIERCPLKVGKIKRLLKIKDRKKIEEIPSFAVNRFLNIF